MRALVLTWEYPPIVEGGLARHVHKLAVQLAASGTEVHVLTRGAAGLAADDLVEGVHVHRVPEPPRPRDLGAFVAWIDDMNDHMRARGAELLRTHEVDVVHAHDWLVAAAGEDLADRAEAPFVATIHATEHGRHQGWVFDQEPQRHIHAVERALAHRADRLIVCSHYMRGHVADVFDLDEQRATVIPNGIDPDDLRPREDLDDLRARFAAPDERLVLLVGRLVHEKGFQFALQALGGPDGVIARAGRVRFLIAGSGTHEAQLRAEARALGLDEHGTFLGWIGDDVLHSLYRISDLCVVPSIYEPFGLVALEAMASGCPCIVADSGGLREVVPDDSVGLRFPARDPRALAAGVERLLGDDDLRSGLVARAAEHVLRFDWAGIARETATVYAEASRAALPAR